VDWKKYAENYDRIFGKKNPDDRPEGTQPK
jgi:hypothetical protein